MIDDFSCKTFKYFKNLKKKSFKGGCFFQNRAFKKSVINIDAKIKDEFRGFFPFCKKARSSLDIKLEKFVYTKTHLAK